ncbi:cof-like hydrolase, putative [Babesia ovis]|uniref:Cof-like hydrolase, putative n=1 Tax=Babesia ovis TaxID=5869 RepID=A0A9W5WUZ4_BABOV|nr:cof-like hydrolase, putative [Babesia ovis]
MKTLVLASKGRTNKRVYPDVFASPEVKAPICDGNTILRFLRDLKRPCTLEGITAALCLDMERSNVLELLDSLVCQGLVRCKKYTGNEIFIYNFGGDNHCTPKKRKPTKSALEKEATQLRLSTAKCSERLQQLRDLTGRSKELVELQRAQKEALEEWHSLLKSGSDLHSLSRVCGTEYIKLYDANVERGTGLSRLQRLFGHIVAGVSDIEGIRPRELCQRLGIDNAANAVNI